MKRKIRELRLQIKKIQGVSNTRNVGILSAKGSYITFVDSDDWLEKDFIEEMYNCIIQNNVDIVRCNYYKVHNDKKGIYKYIISRKFIIYGRFDILF